MSAPSLKEFLLARIAEDEQEALSVSNPISGRDDLWSFRGPFCPGFILNECESKRELLTGDSAITFAERQGRGPSELHRYVAKVLAAPYADHPDYQEEWKP